MSPSRRFTLFAILANLLAAEHARADVTRCASTDATVQYQHALFDELSGDTGWFPTGSPAQLRLTGRMAGSTTVAMDLQPTACWSGGFGVTAPGRSGAGILEFAYGAQLRLFARVHTSVLGNQIDWSGEIPIPTDFALANTATFTPALLPGAATDRVTADDRTSPLTLVRTDLIGTLIGIPGISGGLHLDAVGKLITTYRTTSIELGNETVTSAHGVAPVSPLSAGFGPVLELPLAARGELRYEPALLFNVGVGIEIFGIPIADWTLFGVTLPLPHVEQAIALVGPRARIPLPEAPPLGDARIDFASGSTQTLAVTNTGEAPLELEPTALPSGVTMPRVRLAPGEHGVLVMTAAETAALEGARAELATNDPDQPTLSIALGRGIGGTSTGDEDTEPAGCAAAGGSRGLATFAIMIAAAPLALRRRRQASSPSRRPIRSSPARTRPAAFRSAHRGSRPG